MLTSESTAEVKTKKGLKLQAPGSSKALLKAPTDSHNTKRVRGSWISTLQLLIVMHADSMILCGSFNAGRCRMQPLTVEASHREWGRVMAQKRE